MTVFMIQQLESANIFCADFVKQSADLHTEKSRVLSLL